MLNSPQRRWDCIRKSSNTRGVNCKVCWTQWGFQTINRHVYGLVLRLMHLNSSLPFCQHQVKRKFQYNSILNILICCTCQVYCGNDAAEWTRWVQYLQTCIKHKHSGCVCNTHRNPVAWQMQHLYGSGGIGNTLPEYSGYDMFGHTLMQIIKQFNKLGHDYFGYIALNNKFGMGVAKKYAWKKVGTGSHTFYMPSAAMKL